jgi:predicted PurR-regulated permease PerM
VPGPEGDAAAGPDTPLDLVPPARRIVTVDLSSRSVLAAVVAVAGAALALAVAASGTVTTLLVLGLLLAFALDPVVKAIEQRLSMRRGYAVALLMSTVVLVVAVTVAWLGPQTVEQAQSFQQDLPHVVEDLGSLPLVGDRLTENHVPEHIQEWAANLPKQLSGETSQISTAAEAATTTALAGIGTGVLLVALLVDGPWLVDGAILLVPPRRRPVARRFGTIVGHVIGRYFAGSLLLAALQGAQVLITGLALGVPLSPLLAVWAAIWNMVPQIGGAIGGIVFVAVAFTQGATTGVIAAIVFMIYLVFANNVLLPVILGRAVDISPLSTMAATIAGFFVAGIVGALLAVPLLGAGKALYHEIRSGPHPAETKPVKPGTVRRISRRLRGRSPYDGAVPT